MRVAFFSMNFPPEVNALASRTYRHAVEWARNGGDVEVVTDVPHFPEGEIYGGYENEYREEDHEGVRVHRVPMYVAPNEGVYRRSASFLSFMLSSILHGTQRLRDPDVVAASSPQFLTALAGYAMSRIKSAPFVLEIRDLWPESLIAVDALEQNFVVRALEQLAAYLYRQAEHVVVVTDRFADHVIEKGASPNRVSVIKNGIDLDFYTPPPASEVRSVREELGLGGDFVVSYIGTVGMAHRADVLLEAAEQCDDPEITFLVVGAGAEWEPLQERAENSSATNFRLVGKQPKSRVPALLAATDASVVHLRDTSLFETVLPSKLFEAMAMGNPVIHGVRGESRELVMESGAGIPVPPETPEAIVDAAKELKEHPDTYQQMSKNGQSYARKHHDRRRLAKQYWEIFEEVNVR